MCSTYREAQWEESSFKSIPFILPGTIDILVGDYAAHRYVLYRLQLLDKHFTKQSLPFFLWVCRGLFRGLGNGGQLGACDCISKDIELLLASRSIC